MKYDKLTIVVIICSIIFVTTSFIIYLSDVIASSIITDNVASAVSPDGRYEITLYQARNKYWASSSNLKLYVKKITDSDSSVEDTWRYIDINLNSNNKLDKNNFKFEWLNDGVKINCIDFFEQEDITYRVYWQDIFDEAE